MIKQAKVRHTLGGEDASGWVPPHAPTLPRTPEFTVDILVQIEQVNGGFVLQWIGPSSEFCGNHWYIELPYAEHAAEELFGVTPEQWEAAA